MQRYYHYVWHEAVYGIKPQCFVFNQRIGYIEECDDEYEGGYKYLSSKRWSLMPINKKMKS